MLTYVHACDHHVAFIRVEVDVMMSFRLQQNLLTLWLNIIALSNMNVWNYDIVLLNFVVVRIFANFD